jgi:Bax protein
VNDAGGADKHPEVLPMGGQEPLDEQRHLKLNTTSRGDQPNHHNLLTPKNGKNDFLLALPKKPVLGSAPMLQQTSYKKCRPFAGLSYWLAGILVISGVVLSGCQQSSPPPSSQASIATVQVIEPTDLETLQGFFKTHGYTWEKLENGVPPFIVTRFPEDLDHRVPAEAKKRTFLLSLLPMVLLANQAIVAERQEVEALLSSFERGELTAFEGQRLREIADYYKISGDPLNDQRIRTLLLHRIDILPPSLVLAQAATESGWGTSRFAREGNNLFGQRTYRTGNGLVPANRDEGATHEVKRFGTLFASVRSYMRNLNTHSAYRELRDVRARLRRNGQGFDCSALAAGLEAYSERNQAYIADVRAIIRANDLTRANDAFLRETTVSTIPTFIPTVAELLASRAEAADL